MMTRIPAHVIETRTKDYVRGIINNYYENGDALFRELSERDYGIDGLIELFCNGVPTGQVALIQIKGTEKTIQPLKRKNVVSCNISTSNAKYALQNNVPVLLVYASMSKPQGFYYIDINNAIKNEDISKLNEQDSITIHIPIDNNALEDLEPFFETNRRFYREREG